MIKTWFLKIRYYYGKYLLDKKKYDSAYRVFQKMLDDFPDWVQGYQNVAVVLIEKGEKEKAITYFEKALEIDPLNIDIHNFLFDLYLEAGNIAAAHEMIDWLIENDEGNFHYYIDKALLYGKDNPHAAIELTKRAISFEPEIATLYGNLGWYYSLMGDDENTKKAYEKALKLEPLDSLVLNNLGYQLS